MHRICAYCKKSLGWQMGPEGMTTHGICDDCMKVELAKLKKRWMCKGCGCDILPSYLNDDCDRHAIIINALGDVDWCGPVVEEKEDGNGRVNASQG